MILLLILTILTIGLTVSFILLYRSFEKIRDANAEIIANNLKYGTKIAELRQNTERAIEQVKTDNSQQIALITGSIYRLERKIDGVIGFPHGEEKNGDGIINTEK